MNESIANAVGEKDRPVLTRVVRWIAVGSIPASLVSPGAIVAVGLVALYGVALRTRGCRFPAEIGWVARYTVVLYVALLAIDFANGGGLENLQSTGVAYLHLVALAPFAFALREVGLERRVLDRAMQVTILIALVAAPIQFFLFDVVRPGGLFLNPIPYGFVLALWGVFLLSRGLEAGRGGMISMVAALAASVPVLLTESKIAWACMLLGYAVVAVWWALVRGRWKPLAVAAVAALPLLYLAFHFFGYRRVEPFLVELQVFLDTGTVGAASFGWRYELATSGLRAFLEKPVLGYGLSDQMTAVFAHASRNGPDITFLSHAHNDYVTHLVSFGLGGMAFVLGFLVFAWMVAFGCGDAGSRRAGVAMVVMLALYMLFEIAFNMDPISGSVTVALGMLLLRPEARSDPEDERSRRVSS